MWHMYDGFIVICTTVKIAFIRGSQDYNYKDTEVVA